MTARPPGSRRPLLPGNGPLSRVPPLEAFRVVLGLFGLGAWLGGALGAALLGLLAAGIAVLLAVTWARLTRPERVLRVIVLLVLLAVALERWS